MMDGEQRRLLIWGGSCALILLLGWAHLAVRGGEATRVGNQVRSAHRSYSELYPASGLAVEEALTAAAAANAAQAAQLDDVVARLVWNGSASADVAEEFRGRMLGSSGGTAITGYTAALDLISRVGERLRQAAESAGVTLVTS
ncbi:MAG: hypothetical protein ACYTF0_08010, partial [Planctomycetota bacterium]